jgi:adenylate cyclase
MLRKTLAGLGLGVAAALLVLLVGSISGGPLETAELKTYDWRMRAPAAPTPAPAIALVEINDTSIRDLEKFVGRWPWPRVVLSSVIDYLNRAPAKVIAIDLLIPERDSRTGFKYGDDTWSGKESDDALVGSVKQAGNVVMLADVVYEGAVDAEQANKGAVWQAVPYRLGPRIEERPVVTAPFQTLADASRALGHNFLAFDPDGPARRILPFVRNGNRYLPSLGVAAALVAAGVTPEEVELGARAIRVRDRSMPLVPIRVRNAGDPTKTHEQLTAMINYRASVAADGNARPYPSHEVRHLLLSEEQLQAGVAPMVDPAVFRDKVVFIGLTGSGLMDVFNTPFGDVKVPGIQLHASVADSILSDRFIRPASARVRVATTVLAAIVVGLLTVALPLLGALAAALMFIGGWIWYALHTFRGGLWINMVQPLGAMVLAVFAGTAYQYFVEGRQKRIVKKLFGRYVSKDVYHQLMTNPELAELGGKRREMTVLFSDIRGFTSVTERGDPEALVAQLNEYFSRMVEIVFRHHGTVDKFVGDMVMALFGAPLDDPDHAEHAVQAALDMIRELGELNKTWAARGMAQLDIGIGINSGEMIAGNIGSSSIMSYTVIGDNVNLGSRLESLNKEYKTRIIMSDATRLRLTSPYDTRPLGDVVVKGKTRPVAIYEIKAPAPFVTTEEQTL